ncbi:TRAP transporter large permease [Paeniroseomonas aquatica]|uniref:TRAP transporter large permease protein n=1 Tax=Paeniroseomonas aquatica TaxID=373043 RepID=A0ABT8A299_9PROT|nr:TRAP transporter large permease [Paeniroseomonas aquatica]MDN3563669.1 TRAP transporter large permease [Paeniroseomonas aquatica]
MTSLQIGFAGLGAVFVLIALRVPIGVALGGVSVVGIAVLRSPQAALGALGALPFDFAAHWSLSAVPMFLLMGAVAYHTGMTGSLFRAARLWLGFLPGGLAVATNFAAAGFAAASGSSMATAAAMGRLAIPEMLRARYEPGLATAVVAASGTLGSLIPPSILMVLYGIFAEQPIGRLLIAGIVPGLLTAAVYAAMIILRCWLNPALAPRAEEPAGWAERLAALRQVWPIPVLVLAVIGSLYGGVATPTEAAAVGALAACGIAALQGRMSRAAMGAAVMEALEGTASIFFIAIGAVLLSRFLALSGMPGFLAGLMGSWAVDPLLVVIGASLIYLFLGCFLDPLGLMLLTLPVLLPMFQALNLDLVWIGVLVIKYLEIGLLTPPVGMNAYVVSGIVGKEVPLPTIFRGLLWFLAAEAVIMALLIAYPQISLWLPDLMGR